MEETRETGLVNAKTLHPKRHVGICVCKLRFGSDQQKDGLPVPVCRQFPPPRWAWLPVSRTRDVGPPLVARGPARSGPAPGPGWGPGDCQMAFPWTVLPVRLVGCGAVGTPARLVPGPADGNPGPMCWV